MEKKMGKVLEEIKEMKMIGNGNGNENEKGNKS